MIDLGTDKQYPGVQMPRQFTIGKLHVSKWTCADMSYCLITMFILANYIDNSCLITMFVLANIDK